MDQVPHEWYFALAQAHSLRSGTWGIDRADKRDEDIGKGIGYLKRAIEQKVRHGGALDWSYIKKDSRLVVLRSEKEYISLMRGRRRSVTGR